MKLDILYNKSCQRMDELPDSSVDCILTSPPYWGLRNYGSDVAENWPDGWYGQLGLEPTLKMYIDHLVLVSLECKRVLKPTGVMWWNHGDSYFTGKGSCRNPGGGNKSWKSWNKRKSIHPTGRTAPNRMSKELPPKCLALQGHRLIIKMIDEQGWILRNTTIWNKPNGMPSSVKDRLTNKYESVFMLVKNKKYWFDLDAIREPHKESSKKRYNYSLEGSYTPGNAYLNEKRKKPQHYNLESLKSAGKNPGDVWTIPTQPRPEAHFATFPDKLCIKPILATCPQEICKKCRKARIRLTKTLCEIRQSNPKMTQPKMKMSNDDLAGSRFKYADASSKHYTISWTDCGCNAGFEPGVVLDLFAGRGTVLIMAKKLGRHYVGYELKKEYCEKLIEPVLSDIDPLFRKER